MTPSDALRVEKLERKEQNVETIRKLLVREAYFIDEERKWIGSQKQELASLYGPPSRSPPRHSINPNKTRSDLSKIHVEDHEA